ncbi:MAG: ATP-binding protein [Kiritimatiellae bacterium]|nr:ATP-binding protein [Kiritimatiellia bacterium]
MNSEKSAGRPSFASFMIGLSVALASYFLLGAGVVVSMLLFFPAKGLATAIFRNDGGGCVRSLIVLLLFPVLPVVADFAIARIACVASGTPLAAGRDASAEFIIRIVVSAVTLVAMNIVASIASGVAGDFSLPHPVHSLAVRVLDIVACSLVLFAALVAIRQFDANVAVIPPVAKMALACVAGLLAVMALKRIFSSDYEPPGPAESSSKESSSKKAVPQRLRFPPNITLADVMGMDDAKEQIRLRLIEPVKNPGKARRYGMKIGGGVLLYGPPGTGKTTLARGVAGELKLPFYTITAADVFGKYVGESERNMRALFASIRKNPLSVVFIDELETLFPSRSGDVHETTRKVISVILQELDGLDQTKNPILLIGATNVPWLVDEAFLRPGRFDSRIFVGLPDENARARLVAAALAKGAIPHEPNLIGYIASMTRNYSGADLNGVADRMRQLAYTRNLSVYTRDLADEAVASVKPTANGAMLDEIREWEQKVSGASLKVSGTASKTAAAARSDITLADVAGMEDVKRQITLRLVEPVRNATLAKHYGINPGGGLLLYGPPGTGKTMLARAVAGELDLPFYAITPADIFGKYSGDAERNVRRIFAEARKNDLSVVFMDELETLFPKRTIDVHETTRKVIAMLLQELDGIDSSKNPILLIGATNVPWLVDEAFLRPGRFDVRIFVGMPDAAARRFMADRMLNKGEVRFEEGLEDHIASLTEGFSGADMKGLFERMRQTAFMRRLPYYTKALADEIAASSSPTPSKDITERIREWERSLSQGMAH